MNLLYFRAKETAFARCEEKNQNYLFGVFPNKWTLTSFGVISDDFASFSSQKTAFARCKGKSQNNVYVFFDNS